MKFTFKLNVFTAAGNLQGRISGRIPLGTVPETPTSVVTSSVAGLNDPSTQIIIQIPAVTDKAKRGGLAILGY